MKYLKKILYILCLFVVTVYPFLSVYGDNVVLNNYKQVSSLGGENWEGKDSGKSKNDSSVIISKTISETNYKSGISNIENYFDITLRVQTRTKAEEPDLAVVIVMDISNTMSYVFNGTKKTRISAAQDAAKKFITEFANRSSSNKDIKRQIGFVAFNTNAQEIFALQPCMDTTTANSLKNTMETNTNKIMNAPGYGDSHSRFTNIEAGLKMANDMLSKSNASSKHIIFLSDGFPTTYIYKNYTGYDPYMTPNISSEAEVNRNKTKFFNDYWKANNGKLNPNDDGIFYDSVKEHYYPCYYGTSYSDKAAIRARKMATNVKNAGINIYSIGVDIGGQTIKKYVNQTAGKKFSVVDRTSTTYEIGDDSSADAYKNWLKNKIGSGYYQDVTDESAMTDAFDRIFTKIMEMSEATWVAEDPMNLSGNVKNIEFVGIYDGNKNLRDSVDLTNGSNTASYNDKDKINWDLKNSTPTEIKVGNITYYVYELHYRIRLQNELSTFEEIDKNTGNSKIYDTNGKTTLKYVIKDEKSSKDGEIDFPVPSVVGYLGELEFKKVSTLGDNFTLENAEFELVHSPNCPCHNERKQPSDSTLSYTATSDANGTIKFTSIPSGHKYILKETKAPNDHILNESTYDVEVAYDKTIHKIEGNKIINDYLKSNLNISKEVQGNIENSGTFKFTLVITYNGKPVVGEYPYKKGNETGYITLDSNGKTTIYLKHNETIYIENLPFNSSFKIEELETEGYEVNYKLNDNKITFGKSLESKLDSIEKPTNVKFINIGGYIMPETGSSGMLILVIAGILLTGGSVINICYMYFKKKRLS